MKIRRIFLIALTLILAPLLRADIDASKRSEIEKLLRLTGLENTMNQMITQMLASLKSKLPEASGSFWDKFSSKLNAHDLLDQLIPLYDKYYSLEDLRAVNAFYQSEAGKKIISTMPLIMKEAMTIGQAWGEKVGKQAFDEFKADQDARK